MRAAREIIFSKAKAFVARNEYEEAGNLFAEALKTQEAGPWKRFGSRYNAGSVCESVAANASG